MNAELEEYRAGLLREVERVYRVASEFRARTNSPLPFVEAVFADRMEERVELLVGPKNVAEKIRRYKGRLAGIELAFKLCEEIVYTSMGQASEEEVIKQAVCTALAVLTPPCITAAPSEGISHVRIKQNDDGSKYLAVYFAGPIRAAGGTELATVVVLADYVRRLYGLDRFKARDEEVKRFVEELRTYVRRVSRFQYSVPDRLIAYAYKMTPVEISGVATDNVLTPSYRDLERIETNYLRGGALRVVNDGIVGRAKKVLKVVRSMGMSGWDWIEELAEAQLNVGEEEEEHELEVIGGRPVISLAETFGGFRIRYGRAFTTGMAAYGLHPLTMKVLKGYIVAGTQLKADFPGKGGVVAPVDVLEPPVVKTVDGSVVRVGSEDVFRQVADRLDQVLFLGDILVSVGDCVENNVELRPPGYCEEWWGNDLAAAVLDAGLKQVSDRTGITVNRLAGFLENPLLVIPTAEEAFKLSRAANIPLHPRYLHFWTNIKPHSLQKLREWLAQPLRETETETHLKKDPEVKKILEAVLVEHRVHGDGSISLNKTDLYVLTNLLKPEQNFVLEDEKDTLEALRKISGIVVKDKRGSSLTARMGRPEKAGPRRMKPAVHFLFPLGLAGGQMRDVMNVFSEGGVVAVELVVRRCRECGALGWKERCEACRAPADVYGVCAKCKNVYQASVVEVCGKCGGRVKYTAVQRVDVRKELSEALQKIGEPPPQRISGVKGLTSLTKTPENFLKGVLRAKHGLSVYKDGTVRFDATNAPMTHFTPSMIGTSVEKLRSLGYTHDVHGNHLTSANQICELKLQDLVISRKAAAYLLKASKYVDELLHYSAGMDRLYNLNSVEDLVGQLVVGLSPHTYVAVVGRVIGFVDAEVNFAHPVFHAAKRRDCDGDEDSLMLLADVLMNFSRLFIPDRIGGKMDTPLLITRIVYPEEVDEQAHNVDVWSRIPAEFYRLSSERRKIAEARPLVRTVGDDLEAGTEAVGTSFTHVQSMLTVPGIASAYKTLETMMEKITVQLELMDRLAGVKDAAVVDSIVSSHILPDIIGNVKAFMVQSFRCKKCNKKYRRLPLTGKCPYCQLDLSLTVFRGGVEKYIELAEQMAEKRLRSAYLKENTLAAVETVLDLFKSSRRRSSEPKQTSLESFLTESS
ncbi:MAG: DNA polymerase II large subunit [Candidatus Caldarchaeum sp.]|nr:DNA polymerase II large subunit [Candidatus Caldarchaeum sp.]